MILLPRKCPIDDSSVGERMREGLSRLTKAISGESLCHGGDTKLQSFSFIVCDSTDTGYFLNIFLDRANCEAVRILSSDLLLKSSSMF